MKASAKYLQSKTSVCMPVSPCLSRRGLVSKGQWGRPTFRGSNNNGVQPGCQELQRAMFSQGSFHPYGPRCFFPTCQNPSWLWGTFPISMALLSHWCPGERHTHTHTHMHTLPLVWGWIHWPLPFQILFGAFLLSQYRCNRLQIGVVGSRPVRGKAVCASPAEEDKTQAVL